MKKKKPQWTTRISQSPKNSVLYSNEFRLKQVYDGGITSRNRSPKNSQKKQSLATRYQLPLTDRKQQQKINKYQSYLQNEVISKMKPNRRYNKNNDKVEENPYLDRPDRISNKKEGNRGQNESVDMFKIRKKKLSSHKVSASSHIKLNESFNNFEQGKQLYRQKRYDEALNIFHNCLRQQENNCEYLYYSAIIYLNKHQYKEGLEYLQKIIKNNPIFKKSIYLFAAISAKNINNLNRAFSICSEGISEYPKYSDLICYRGKISQLQQDYEQAHKDFEEVLSHDKNNIQILLKNANCLRKIGAYANCLSNLAAALYIDKGQNKNQILKQRIEVHVKMDNMKQAKKDLNKLIHKGEELSSQLLYLKGLILLNQGYKKQGILCFQQCLKHATNKQIMCSSLVQITKIKIQDRDFYSAFYHINRSQHLKITNSQIQIYKCFCEGVVYLMKRKITQADKNFQLLVSKYPHLTPYIKKIFHLYRAFAKFMISDYPKTIQDYEDANQQIPLDSYAKYNKLLAQGIVKVHSKNYEEAINIFNVAEKTLSGSGINKIQSFLYRGATHIEKAKDCIHTENDLEDLRSLQEIFSGLKQLDKAYDINDSNSNMLYFRGLVYLYLGKYEEALQDIIKAISKSEENVAKYFFFRAITHASLNNRKQAMNDLNICTNLDDKFHYAYLEKAKIDFANENVTKGLQDLAKLGSVKQGQDIKYHECCLNFVHGHNVMANACVDDIKNADNALKMRILLSIRLGKVKTALKHLTSKTDKMICEIMLGNVQVPQQIPTDLEYFSMFHYHHYLGLKQFKLQNYDKAIDSFSMAIKQKNLYDLQQGISNNNLQSSIDDKESEEEEQEETEQDIVNRINYNIFVCHLLAGQHKRGYEVFIRDVLGAKESLLKNQFMGSFSHILFQSMKSGHSKEFEEKEIYELSIYDSKLDTLYDQIIIQLPNFILKTRICFLTLSNPKLQRQYKPKTNSDFVLEFMKLSEIENRPEPPWVKRKEEGLIFTDQVQNINIEFETTQNDEEEEDEDEGNSDQDDDESYEEQSESEAEKMSFGKFKEKMKLDDSIQRKLQKIMDKKK